MLLVREQGIKTLLQISAEEFPELHTTNIVPKHREGRKKTSSRLGWHRRDAKGPPPTAAPLPQPINDVLCFSKINLIQCTSDFVLHVLENKVTQQLFNHLSSLQGRCSTRVPLTTTARALPALRSPGNPWDSASAPIPAAWALLLLSPPSPSLQAMGALCTTRGQLLSSSAEMENASPKLPGQRPSPGAAPRARSVPQDNQQSRALCSGVTLNF